MTYQVKLGSGFLFI